MTQAQTTTTATTVDYSRIQKAIFAQQQKLEQMQAFLMRNSMKLEAAAPAIQKFLEANKLVLPKYTNSYSTGDANEYAADADMLIDCYAVYTEGIKNIKLWQKRFEGKWNATIKTEPK